VTEVIHAYPLESGGHSGDRHCPCGPKPYADLLVPARQVWVHRAPTTAYGARTIHDPYPPKSPRHSRHRPPPQPRPAGSSHVGSAGRGSR
jgi:hypothetical protein